MKKLAFITLALTFPFFAHSQFIQGVYVEIGIDFDGGFEGLDTSAGLPPGSHPRPGGGNLLGMVANPQMNGWATFDGDFFAPGSAENGWGFEVDSTGGVSKSNNCASASPDISGNVNFLSYIGTTWSLEWEGHDSVSDLTFKIKYTLDDSALFYTTAVTVTNNSAATISDLYYYRNIDPDNNQSLSGEFFTTNTIVDQHSPGSTDLAFVTATSVMPASQPMSYIGLMALDTAGWMAGYGGFSNRDASDCYHGTGSPFDFEQEVDSSRHADIAIFLAHRTQNLAPAASETFKFATLFAPSTIPCAMSAGKVSLTDLYICWSDTINTISTGSPAGGTYTGGGIVGTTLDSLFSGGTYYSYTYVDTTNGCSTSEIAYMEKIEPQAYLFPFSDVCNTVPSITLSGGFPGGGIYSGTGVSAGLFNPASAGPGNFDITYTYVYEGCASSDVENIQVNNCVGIEEEYASQLVRIYPNPFSEQVSINIGKELVLHNASYEIYDVLGQMITSNTEITSNHFTIGKGLLKPGVYLINLFNDQKVLATEKLIVE